jgi:DNA helicase IV
VLAREGVLVVGPNRVFLDYIANVLPSLGERSVQQRTVGDLAVPRVEVTGTDSVAAARVKGSAVMSTVLERAALAQIAVPADAVRAPLGSTSVVVEPEQVQEWIATALAGTQPLNRRREALRVVAEQALRRRTGRDDVWAEAPAVRATLARAWPVVRPRPLVERLLSRRDVLTAASVGLLSPEEQSLVLTRTGRNKRWTPADQVLLDAANTFLNGPPATVGHVVVDEAQDLSALALATVANRCPSGSLTILGDLAQSTGPAGQSSWEDVIENLGGGRSARVEHLTIGYRVPAPILDVANRLLPSTGVTVPASRSVRPEGHPPGVRFSSDPAAAAAAEVVALRRHHRLTGVIAASRWHPPLADALAGVDLRAVAHVQELDDDEVPVFGYEEVKGLELDGVVVVEPGEVLDGSQRGARLVYVALTRAVQELTIVCSDELPEVLRWPAPATVPA